MKSFQYHMPTKIFFGKNCILENKEVFKTLGERALIVTGGNSSKNNGSLKDVTDALTAVGVLYTVFDKTEQNPSINTFCEAGLTGINFKADFVIGIGGGSPMDTAKAASFVVANPKKNPEKALMSAEPLKKVPLVEIPTTSGTGSETTAVSVATMKDKQTKGSIPQKGFADIAFLDAKYTQNLPADITNSTAIDALAHIIEGYMNANYNYMSDRMAEMALLEFKRCIPKLIKREYDFEFRERLMLISSIAGMIIAQTGTSIPHTMSYSLTYFRGIPHGKACGMLLREYLKSFSDKQKVNNLLMFMGLSGIDDLDRFIVSLFADAETFTEEEIKKYTDIVMENPAKLLTYPKPLKKDDIYNMYKKSLIAE